MKKTIAQITMIIHTIEIASNHLSRVVMSASMI
jgi:hypothetical protein